MMRESTGWRRSRLGYCSNVHPGTTLEQVRHVVANPIRRVREMRSLETMQAGLWLGARVARVLCSDSRRFDAFAGLLGDSGVKLRTLNGFPFDDFHTERVKEAVYLPDWADPKRLDYTLDLARILAAALPGGESEGTISTLPLGFAARWDQERHAQSLDTLCRLAIELDRLAQREGRPVRVCLEMEPGCVLETTGQVIGFFNDDLAVAAKRHGVSASLLSNYLGVCYDICHQAVMFEQPGLSLKQLNSAGITVGKIQVSSALEADPPGSGETLKQLATFAEHRYLHQVRMQRADGTLAGVADLPEALREGGLADDGPWRVHFHLPIQIATIPDSSLTTTQGAILDVLDYLRALPGFRPHLEVETYTWHVLPEALRPADDGALQKGLVGELNWLEGEMRQRGLIEEESL